MKERSITDIINRAGAAVLIKRIISPGKTKAVMNSAPQKTKMLADSYSDISDRCERVLPESEGVDSADIAKLLQKIKNDRSLNMHSMVIMRHGKVLFECGFGDYSPCIPQMTYSACKSIVSLAIGMLIDDGKIALSDRAVDILGVKNKLIPQIVHRDITVENLLTMSSGVAFSEADSVTESDWVKGFFESTKKFEAGKKFEYNSMNTYILSAIVRAAAKMSLSDFLRQRLFLPLGIHDWFWEKSPDGIEKGGWGLYIRPEDMGKIGTMLLDGGLYNGKRILSSRYINAALLPKMTAPTSYGDFNYGYQIWCSRDGGSFLFNGMLGQNMLAFKNSGLIIITTAGAAEMFQQSNYFKYVFSCFNKELPQGPVAAKRESISFLKDTLCELKRPPVNIFAGTAVKTHKTNLFSFLAGREDKRELPEICDLFSGEYFLQPQKAPDFGIMPLFLQVLQNNYTPGISGIKLFKKDGRLSVRVSHGDSMTFNFTVDFKSCTHTVFKFGGEVYRVGVSAAATSDEYGNPVLLFKISFTETPFERIIKLYYDNAGALKLKMDEKPGADFLRVYLNGISAEEKNAALSGLISKLDSGYAEYKINSIFSPEAVLFPEKQPPRKNTAKVSGVRKKRL